MTRQKPDAIAAICLTSDIVPGSHVAVCLGKVVVGYDNDDNEEYSMGDETTIAPGVEILELPSPITGDRGDVEREAVDALQARGWYVEGGWEHSDNAAYADVFRY